MFSKTELRVLHYIANGTTEARTISKELDVTPAQIYNAIHGLKRKGVLESGQGAVLSTAPFALRLAEIMSASPDRCYVLSGSSIPVLSELREPGSAEDVVRRTGISRATVFRKIKDAGQMGAVRQLDGGRYTLNDRLWPNLRKLLDDMEDEKEVFDPRVERGSRIYSNTSEEVLYSYPNLIPATRTAFSVFSDYGFKAFYDTYYYTTSDGPVDMNRAFADAYRITEIEKDHRLCMGLILFYLKNKNRITPPDEFTKQLNRVMTGESIDGWPSRIDLEDRMVMYL